MCAVSLSFSPLSLPLSLSLSLPLPPFSRLGQRRRGGLRRGRRLRVHVRALEHLVEHLGQRRVRVHAELDVLDALARRDGVGGLVDEVGGVEADDVHAEDLARVLRRGVGCFFVCVKKRGNWKREKRKISFCFSKFVEERKRRRKKKKLSKKTLEKEKTLYLAVDHLGQAVPFLLRQRLRVGLERRLDHRHRVGVPAGLGRLARGLLGRSHERDVGVREAGRGHGRGVVDVRAAAHVLDGGDALGRRGVREHVLACC